MQSFFWHDYETWGADPRRDRPAQFAGLRTDLELRPLEEPVCWYCRAPDDYLPDPDACLVTGITPQLAQAQGLAECELAARIQHQMTRPGTCSVGYNSMRFDDEVTRFLFWRNFIEPYDREWKDGNSRWDLIDVARLCYALRPEGLEWPEHEPGKPSFRLQDLAAANGLVHEQAHDALSDVMATIELARRLNASQPRLFAWCLKLRDKAQVRRLIDLPGMTPLLHASSRFPAERGCLAMVAPICPHPVNGNGIIVYDLSADPSVLINEDDDMVRDLVFTARDDLPEDCDRIPLKVLHVNRSPVVAPLSVLQGADLQRIGLDEPACRRHLDLLRAADGLRSKVARVFDQPWQGEPPEAEEALYDGFVSGADQALLRQVRSATASDLAALEGRFGDERLNALLRRYRARNHPDTLSTEEHQRWIEWCGACVSRPDPDGGQPRHQTIRSRIRTLRQQGNLDGAQLALLDQVDAWVLERCAAAGVALADAERRRCAR